MKVWQISFDSQKHEKYALRAKNNIGLSEIETFFSSPELKAQVSSSDRPLSGIRLSVCPSVNFYIFDFFSRTTGPILTRIGANHPWVKGIQVSSKEGDSPSPRGDNGERVKIH
jgi:hypothetical protein